MQLDVTFVGSGRAASAIHKALLILCEGHKDLEIASVRTLKRGESLSNAQKKAGHQSLLIIANPHALHAAYLEQGIKAGFDKILVEKPSCTSLEQSAALRKLETASQVAVAHGYRQSWGPQELRRLVHTGELGDLVAMSGHYLQSSAAERFLSPSDKPSWKNDPKLSGPFDVFLDLGLHWADLAAFTVGECPKKSKAERLYTHAEASHRDTQIFLELEFSKNLKARATVSKLWHGSNNDLELSLLGTKASAKWNFLRPDEIEIGRGSDRQILTRKKATAGSQLAPFHASGWLEGYIEVLSGLLLGPKNNYPTLKENLDLLDVLLAAEKN